MKYGYARVSTVKQLKNGYGLEVQKNALLSEGILEENIVLEKYTGTTTDRPQLKKLMEQLKEGDTLVVPKLDRLSRSVKEGIELVNELADRGIKVHILNIGLLDNSPAGKLVRNVFFAFAEFERDLIVERIAEGKMIAKQKDGYREGRPRVHSRKKLDLALELLKTKTLKEVANTLQVSESTIKRYKRKMKDEGKI